MYDLNRLRKHTKIKMIMMILSTLLPIIIISVLTPVSQKYFSDYVSISIKVLRYVIVGFGEAFIILKIVSYARILISDSYANKILIKNNDERLTFIAQKISSFTLKLVLFILLIAIVVFGFLNTIIFITLCATLIVILICYFFVSIYYKRKY